MKAPIRTAIILSLTLATTAAFAADSASLVGPSATGQSACPNLPGYASPTPPAGMTIDPMGNCVPDSSGVQKPKKKLYSGSSQGPVSMDEYHGVFCYDSSGWCRAPVPKLDLNPAIDLGGVKLSLIEGGLQTGYTTFIEYIWNAVVQGPHAMTTIANCQSIKINGVDVSSDFSNNAYGYIGGSALHSVFSNLPMGSTARVDLVNCEVVTVPF